MGQSKINILFFTWADAVNVNAQSLNARDIALRLDPAKFSSTFFISGQPDPRLVKQPHVHLISLPPRLGSLRIARQMIWGNYQILFNPPLAGTRTGGQILHYAGRTKKIVCTIEGSVRQLEELPQDMLQKQINLWARADAVYAISQDIAQGVSEAFGLKTQVIPVGVDPEYFTECDREGHTGPIKIIYVGSLQPRKRVHILLEFAHRLATDQVEFHIIGDSVGSVAYAQELFAQKERLRPDNVTFHGQLDQSQVREWMNRSDILILPSHLEGTPKVLFEAAATGLPCLIFDDYRTFAVIDGVTGIQVKTDDEMFERLLFLIQNRTVRLDFGRAGAKHIKQYHWEGIAKQWEQEFSRITNSSI